MPFKKVKSLRRRNTTLATIFFNCSIEVNSYLGIFDQMLEVWISTVFANESFVAEILFEFINLILVLFSEQIEPSLSNQDSKLISFSFVEVDISRILHKDRYIL